MFVRFFYHENGLTLATNQHAAFVRKDWFASYTSWQLSLTTYLSTERWRIYGDPKTVPHLRVIYHFPSRKGGEMVNHKYVRILCFVHSSPLYQKDVLLRFTRDSNPEPSDPKSDALSIEPANHCSGVCRSQSRRIYTFISHLLKALRDGNEAHLLLRAKWSSTTLDRWIKYMGCRNIKE